MEEPNIDHDYAINNSVQDFSISPNNHEQYDILTFFANVKQRVQDLLKKRL